MPNTDRMPLDDSMSLRVTRSVPAWTVLTALVAVVAQAVLLWSGQLAQAEKIAALTVALRDQSALIAQRQAQTEHLVEILNETNRRTDRNDYQLSDHERRINALERPLPVDTRNATPRRSP